MLKNSFLALSSLMSAVVFAGDMGAKQEWQLAGHALYLQPTNSINGLVNLSQNITQQTASIGLNPDWSWGFALDTAYTFTSGNRVDLNWFHFRNSAYNSNLDTLFNVQNFLFPGQLLDQLSLDSSLQSFSLAWDQVNLMFAKDLALGSSDLLRLHAGINFSHISYQSHANYIGFLTILTRTGNFNFLGDITTSYNGFGPRVGLDLTHQFDNGFAVAGRAAVSALAGSKQYNYANQLNLANLALFSGEINAAQPKVVPELDTALSVSYDFNTHYGQLLADVSWLWVNYFNALGQNSDAFGVQGLYFGLSYLY